MTRLPGTPLSECLYSLNPEEFNTISEDMKTYLTELRSLRVENFEQRSYIGAVGFREVKDKMFRTVRKGRERGPLDTVSDFHNNIWERWEDATSQSKPNNYVHVIRLMYAERCNNQILFTHGD